MCPYPTIHYRLKSIGESSSLKFDLYNLSVTCGMGFKRGQNRLQCISKICEIVYNFKFTIRTKFKYKKGKEFAQTALAYVNDCSVSE